MKLIIITLILVLVSLSLTNKMKPSKDPIVSFDDQRLIVDRHNSYRNDVASQKTTIEPKMLPFAQNMLQMYWNDEIAKKAQAVANSCQTKHSILQNRKTEKFILGENLYLLEADDKQKWVEVVDGWFKEISAFRNKNVLSYVAGDITSENFSQMIWANSYQIGCGFAKCKEKSFYVCHYGPIGNVIGKSVYKSASVSTCSCPKDTKCLNVEYKQLCCPTGHCKKDNLNFNGIIEGTAAMIG